MHVSTFGRFPMPAFGRFPTPASRSWGLWRCRSLRSVHRPFTKIELAMKWACIGLQAYRACWFMFLADPLGRGGTPTPGSFHSFRMTPNPEPCPEATAGLLSQVIIGEAGLRGDLMEGARRNQLRGFLSASVFATRCALRSPSPSRLPSLH